MKEYDFIKLELKNGDKVFINLMKISLCTVKNTLVEITFLNGDKYVLNREVCDELLNELNFWSINDN